MLTLSGIRKAYGERVLFAEATLQVNREDRIGLVGPNGAGKAGEPKGIIVIEEPIPKRYSIGMSFEQVLEELPALTAQERQILIRRALELDDPPLSESEEALINSRLEAHHRNPSSSVSLDEMKTRLRGRSAR